MHEQDVVLLSHLVAVKRDWSESRRRGALAAYRAYLAAAAAGRAGSPTLDVDEIWHAHILNTQSYARYCEANFGRFVHHTAYLTEALASAVRARLDDGASQGRDAGPDAGARLADCGPEGPEGPGCDERHRLADCGAPEQPEPDPDRGLRRRNAWRDTARALADCGADQPPPDDPTCVTVPGGTPAFAPSHAAL